MGRAIRSDMKGKYAPLYDHLLTFKGDDWSTNFAAIEAILGFRLPDSAREYQAWWSNQAASGSHTHAQSWQRAGWKVRHLNLEAETLEFRRDGEAAMSRPVSKSIGEVLVDDNPEAVNPEAADTVLEALRQNQASPAYSLFEQLARWVMSDAYETELRPGRSDGVNKLFDMVSSDGAIIGDAKYFSMVGGKQTPPAKLSVISEHVWLLQKSKARTKFLVFGNDRRVPEKWLERYGALCGDVEFHFLSDDGRLDRLA